MSPFAIVLSTIVFFGSLALIFSEKVNRSIVAIAGSMLMIIVGKILGFYTEEAAIEAIDFNTLGLLMGMMILVGLMALAFKNDVERRWDVIVGQLRELTG